MTLTIRQQHVLALIAQGGDLAAAEIADHLRLPDSTARTALAALEGRGLAQRRYTGLTSGRRTAWQITRLGAEVAGALFSDDDEVEVPW